MRVSLRWSFWFTVLLFVCLTTGGTWRFLGPPASKVPLESLTRTPPHTEEIPDSDPMRLASRAESLRPLGPIPFQRKTVGRVGFATAVAGSEHEFPEPSVTYLPDIQVYVVRTRTGFGAFVGRDEHWLDRPIEWDPRLSQFEEPRRGYGFTMFGSCLYGPCFYDLSRYAVRVEGGKVLIDLGTRYVDSGFR